MRKAWIIVLLTIALTEGCKAPKEVTIYRATPIPQEQEEPVPETAAYEFPIPYEDEADPCSPNEDEDLMEEMNREFSQSILTDIPGTFTLHVAACDEDRGRVSGGGRYEPDSHVEISAEPCQGFRFSAWSDGVKSNPRTIHVVENCLYVALFEPDQALTQHPDILAKDDEIEIRGAKGIRIRILDTYGRVVLDELCPNVISRYRIPVAGCYLVKVGDHMERKVVVNTGF